MSTLNAAMVYDDILLQTTSLQIVFIIFYIIVFLLGISGNLLVVYVVLRKKAMQSTTNINIANLATSDIMMGLFAIPFTPLTFFMESWIFGEFLCALLPMTMCILVYVSTLSCTVIAVLRYFAIVYPLKPKIGRCTCFVIVVFIWTLSTAISWPLGYFRKTIIVNDTVICRKTWPNEQSRQSFTFTNMILQYLIPCSIIIYCYVQISLALDRRSKSRVVRNSTDSEREQREIQRKRRTNKMMIYVVTIFVVCWMPLNLFHIISDFHQTYSPYYSLIFFIAHLVAMSSTIYNPFIYAFMSEKFKTEFKDLLRCQQFCE
ncbi:neuropeptide Y receptor type 5-like [Ruditapes philippinarum]|uniref:neuropeptide Y receptor type 5-like n=1 Tax=Ruditapes philippinarum TaxID=129788 RepID=UPI00295C1610|nr:neuropeptide Y receptor type 5-like [Ruditapes philippinarum]